MKIVQPWVLSLAALGAGCSGEVGEATPDTTDSIAASGTGLRGEYFDNVDFTGAIGGQTGDNSVYRVIVNGTAGDDVVSISGKEANQTVIGLAAVVNLFNSELERVSKL